MHIILDEGRRSRFPRKFLEKLDALKSLLRPLWDRSRVVVAMDKITVVANGKKFERTVK